MCYVSVCPVFPHHDSNFCYGSVITAGDHAATRIETCCDLAVVDLGQEHGRHGLGHVQERHYGFGSLWSASSEGMGSSIATGTVCPSLMIVT